MSITNNNDSVFDFKGKGKAVNFHEMKIHVCTFKKEKDFS